MADAQVATAMASDDAARWQCYPMPSVAIENTRASAMAQQRAGVVSLLRQQPPWTGGRLGAGGDRALANLDVSRAG